MNEQECLDFIAKELWSGVRGMALGNVGKKRIVVELAEGEEPSVSCESVHRDAIEAGEDLAPYRSIPPRPSERGDDLRVHVGERVIPTNLNESFERFARSLDYWGKRGASSQE